MAVKHAQGAKARRRRPLNWYPFSSLGVSYIAEQAYCEKRVDLWLRDPGDLVSIPADLRLEEPAVMEQVEIADLGTEFHKTLALSAAQASWPEAKRLLRSGQSLVMLEASLKGSYGRLPLIGRPDAICFDGMAASCVLEYKVTNSNQLHTSHRVQLLLYGYLLEQEHFQVDALILACVLIPRKSQAWLGGLTETKAKAFVDNVRRSAENLVSSSPSRKNWYDPDVRVGRGVMVKVRAFRYDGAKARSELGFFSDYWLGRRRAKPTTNPNKCAVCLYNAIDLCPVPVVRYGGEVIT